MYYYCQVAVLVHNKHSLHCSKILYHLGINRGRVLIYEGIEYTLKIIFDYCSLSQFALLAYDKHSLHCGNVQFILQIFSSDGFKKLI